MIISLAKPKKTHTALDKHFEDVLKNTERKFRVKENYTGDFYFQYDYDEYLWSHGKDGTKAVILGMIINSGDTIATQSGEAIVTSSWGSYYLYARFLDKEYSVSIDDPKHHLHFDNDYIYTTDIISVNGNKNIDELIYNWITKHIKNKEL